MTVRLGAMVKTLNPEGEVFKEFESEDIKLIVKALLYFGKNHANYRKKVKNIIEEYGLRLECISAILAEANALDLGSE